MDAFNETDTIFQYSGNPSPTPSVSFKSGYVDSNHFDEKIPKGAKYGFINVILIQICNFIKARIILLL